MAAGRLKIDKMILILGYTPEGDYEDLILNDISQAVFSLEYAKELSDKLLSDYLC